MQVSEITQEQLDELFNRKIALEQDNAVLTEDLKLVKTQIFALLTKFQIINDEGERIKPSKLKLMQDITQMVAEGFTGKEDTFINTVFMPLLPLASKYKHL